MLRIVTSSKANLWAIVGNLIDVSGVPAVTQVSMKHDPGDTMVVLGNKYLQRFQSEGLMPKNRKIASVGGRVHNLSGYDCKVIFSYDPYMVNKDYKTKLDIEWAIQLALRLELTGKEEPVLGKYEYVDSFAKLVARVKQLSVDDNPIPVTLDLETIGLVEHDPEAWIESISFTVDEGGSHLYRFRDKKSQPFIKTAQGKCKIVSAQKILASQIKWLCTTNKIKMIGANLKYDARWIKEKWGFKIENFTFDTTIVGSLLDENVSNSLTIHAKRYTTMGGYDSALNTTYDKGRMGLIPDEPFLTYAGGDTDACYRAMNVLRKELLKDKALTNFYIELLHPALRVFEDIEAEGVLVDYDHFMTFQRDLVIELDDLNKTAKGLMSRHIVNKHYGHDADGKEVFRLTKSAIIKEFMFGPRGLGLKPLKYTPKAKDNTWKYASTAKEHLMMFDGNPKAQAFVDLLKDYGAANKTLSTYVDGFLKHLRQDGRFHATFILFHGSYDSSNSDGGTNTGRSSCTNPALQCLKGDSFVLTDKGEVPIVALIANYEWGIPYNVRTHTGVWKPVVGVYHNGIQPVYRLTTKRGYVLECTGNHPLLTDEGFILAERISVGYSVYININTQEIQDARLYRFNWEEIRKVSGSGTIQGYKSSDLGLSMQLWKNYFSTFWESTIRKYGIMWMFLGISKDSAWSSEARKIYVNLSNMGFDEDEMSKYQSQGVPFLWRSWYRLLRGLGGFLRVLKGYGRKARRLYFRPNRQYKRVLQEKLSLGVKGRSKQEQIKQSNANLQQRDFVYGGHGKEIRYPAICTKEEIEQRLAHGKGNRDSCEAAKVGDYSLDTIISIEYVGNHKTYDLTIKDSHSFIANGFVVHNTVPKHTKYAKRLRRGYPAPKDYVWVEWDFSQGELRIAAVIAKEPTMISLYLEGYDQHMVTGGRLNGYSIADMLEMKVANPAKYKMLRQGGKAGNFGLIYRMTAKGFREYARTTYGVILTLEEAERAVQIFFDLYPEILTWHDRQITFAKTHGYVRSPLGRVRHLPLINSPDSEVRSKAERQSINAPVQATLSDLSIYSLALFKKRYGTPDECRFCMFEHDAIKAYVREDKLTYWVPLVKELMETLPLEEKFGWNVPIPFVADAEVGRTLGDMKEIDDYELFQKNHLNFLGCN